MKLYLSIGDPAGVGPELSLQFLRTLAVRSSLFGSSQNKKFPAGYEALINKMQRRLLQLYLVGNKKVMFYAAMVLDESLRRNVNKKFSLEKLFNFFSKRFSNRITYVQLLTDVCNGKLPGFFFYEAASKNVSVKEKIGGSSKNTKREESEKSVEGGISVSSNFNINIKPSMCMPGKEAGKVALQTLNACCASIEKDIKNKIPAALVTLPIDKQSISQHLGKRFVGHTSFFAKKYLDDENAVSMAFSTPMFQMVLMTVHIPLGEVSPMLRKKKVGKQIISTAIKNALQMQRLYKDLQPLKVMGVNPHAGEGGLLGTEEQIISQVLETFRRRGHKIEGPLPADGLMRMVVSSANKKNAIKPTIVSPFHDQGLVAAKMAAPNFNAVNITLGLPFVRTSVDHGTAYNLAYKNIANPASLYLAASEAVRFLSL